MLLLLVKLSCSKCVFYCCTLLHFREIFLYTVTILNASPLTTRIIIAFFHVLISPCKNHESKYSHCKNIPTAKSAFHIPHQIKIKVSIYITRDQTVALWQHLGPSHFHVCHRIAILFTALKHITIVHFVFLSITFEYFLFYCFILSITTSRVTIGTGTS